MQGVDVGMWVGARVCSGQKAWACEQGHVVGRSGHVSKGISDKRCNASFHHIPEKIPMACSGKMCTQEGISIGMDGEGWSW